MKTYLSACDRHGLRPPAAILRALHYLAAAAIALAGTAAAAQVITPPAIVTLRIQVTDDRQHGIPNVNVVVMDAVGGASAAAGKLTDSDGRVEFRTVTGGHRVRIYGSEIEEYEGEFGIAPNEAMHVETIRVRLKPAAGTQPAPGEPTAAVRLRIPRAAEKEFDAGNKALRKSAWKPAETHYRAAVARYRDYDLAYNALGVALANQGNTVAAQEAFEQAIRANASYATAKRNLARIVFAGHDYLRTEKLLRESLQIEPTHVWAMATLAASELQLHEYQAAAADAQRVHALPHQGLESAHITAAMALEALGAPSEAIAEYEQLLREAPKSPEAAYVRNALARLQNSH